MKVACGYTIPITKYGLPPSLENHLKAMEEVKRSGFSALEMELVAGEKDYITNWGKVIQKSKDLSLDVPSIMAVTYDMFSLDSQKQKQSISHFAEICALTRDIGAKMVTNCFYLPPELVPEEKTELYHGGPPVTISTPENFSWSTLRAIVLNQMIEMANLAKQNGLDFALELRAGDFLSSVDGIIHLMNETGADNIGVVYDCAHIHAVKEYLELAILKFGKYIKLVHLSDNDGTQAYHYVPGQGNIDFPGILKRLYEVGYDDYLVVDISGVDDILVEAEKMKNNLEKLINSH